MVFNKLLAVRRSPQYDTLICTIQATLEGVRSEIEYVLAPGDEYGLAPAVRAAVAQHVSFGRPIADFVPLTAEQIRAAMPQLSKRQFFLALLSIGITEDMILAALSGDPEGVIEMRWSGYLSRTHPLIDAVGNQFDITPGQIDGLWMWAKDL